MHGNKDTVKEKYTSRDFFWCLRGRNKAPFPMQFYTDHYNMVLNIAGTSDGPHNRHVRLILLYVYTFYSRLLSL